MSYIKSDRSHTLVLKQRILYAHKETDSSHVRKETTTRPDKNPSIPYTLYTIGSSVPHYYVNCDKIQYMYVVYRTYVINNNKAVEKE